MAAAGAPAQDECQLERDIVGDESASHTNSTTFAHDIGEMPCCLPDRCQRKIAPHKTTIVILDRIATALLLMEGHQCRIISKDSNAVLALGTGGKAKPAYLMRDNPHIHPQIDLHTRMEFEL